MFKNTAKEKYKIKRAVIFIVILTVLSGALFPSSNTAVAATTYLFIYNDEFRQISSATPPIIRGDATCMPLLQEITSYTRAKSVYDDTTKTLTLMLPSGTAYNFYFETGYAQVNEEEPVYAPAFYENGEYYMPMEFLASKFGFLFSKITDGIYRMQTQAGKYTNAQYTRIFESRVNPDAAENKTPVFYLCFEEQPSAETGAILDALRQNGVIACFFMTDAAMKQRPNMVRRIVAEGHEVGLSPPRSLSRANSETLLSYIEEANTTFEMITKQRAVLTMPIQGREGLFSQAARTLLTRNSYRVWQVTLPYPEQNRNESAASARSELTAVLPFINWNCVVSVRANSGLTGHINSLSSLAAGNFTMGRINEFVSPVNYYLDTR